jgi:hypothetical protein
MEDTMRSDKLLASVLGLGLLLGSSGFAKAQDLSTDILPGKVIVRLLDELPNVSGRILQLQISDLQLVDTQIVREFRVLGVSNLTRANPSLITHPGMQGIGAERTIGNWILDIPSEISPVEVAKRLEQLAGVVYASPVYMDSVDYMPTDPQFPNSQLPTHRLR